ncbi:MAG: cytochrome c biogenesis protein CcdA [Candidatus Goldbacteria bacterium]|nr:cytochrome c biogenesis protein CcdA [Candidatus Goldiibacteriota bacterium]
MEHTVTQNITFFTAFIAGILSFLSPCILPLIPGYISFISGISLQDLRNNTDIIKVKSKVINNSLAFVVGFSFVFISFGASATFIGSLLSKYSKIITYISGIIIIILGIHLTGIFRISALYSEKRLNITQKPLNIFGSFIIGFAFAFGWTPCIGPILAAILALAASQETLNRGILLLTWYSLGLAIPFILTAYSLTLFFKIFDKIKKYLYIIEWISGILLIIIGILMITGGLIKIASLLTVFDIFTK